MSDPRFSEPSSQWLAWHEEASGNRDKMFDLAERDLRAARDEIERLQKLLEEEA